MSTYNRYAADDIVISTDRVSTSTWSNNTNNLTVAYTSSTQADFSSATSLGAFRIDVYNLNPQTDDTAEVQYSVAYGHRKGSGSLDFTTGEGGYGYSPSRDIYSQYRSLVYGSDLSDFVFDTTTPDDIFVININRSRYKQNLKPGTLNLKLSDGSNEITLTDDYVTASGSAVITNIGRQFNVVLGSNGIRLGNSLSQTDSGSYGLFYPDAGFIILNAGALEETLTSFTINRTNNNSSNNHETFYQAISESGYFIVDSEEKISSQYYFTRIKNQEFNYTTNPTFIETDGTLSFSSMNDNPRTYITTVGLYNDNNELVAVAKLSQPLAKDFTKEALIKVKLDY